jgi:hypothetical protein
MVWPDATGYRVLPPGVLRAILGEGRADVSPLSRGRAKQVGEGERLGYRTRTMELRSPYATVRIDVAMVPEAGEGGQLLCRLLVEAAGVDPSTGDCAAPELALAADYSWHGRDGSAIAFEVTGISRQSDLSSRELAAPPRGVQRIGSDVPSAPKGRFFSDDELADWRMADGPAPEDPSPRAPERGVLAVNRADMPMYLVVDGVPIAVVSPWSELALPGLRNGRYSVQWRSFLGEVVGEVAEREVPARIVWGVEEPEVAPETPGRDAG